MNDKQEKFNWLKSLLTGWGIKESWAKVIAGAIIGAIAAYTMTSCIWDLKAANSEQIWESNVVILPVENWQK